MITINLISFRNELTLAANGGVERHPQLVRLAQGLMWHNGRDVVHQLTSSNFSLAIEPRVLGLIHPGVDNFPLTNPPSEPAPSVLVKMIQNILDGSHVQRLHRPIHGKHGGGQTARYYTILHKEGRELLAGEIINDTLLCIHKRQLQTERTAQHRLTVVVHITRARRGDGTVGIHLEPVAHGSGAWDVQQRHAQHFNQNSLPMPRLHT